MAGIKLVVSRQIGPPHNPGPAKRPKQLPETRRYQNAKTNSEDAFPYGSG